MNKLKESILNDAKKDTSNASNETTSVTITATTPANSTTNTATSDTYIYDVGILAVLAIGICIFFANNTSQAANKNQINEKQPKRQENLNTDKWDASSAFYSWLTGQGDLSRVKQNIFTKNTLM